MKKRKNLNVWPAIVMFLLLIVSTAAGRTIYVDDDGPADFTTIQAAIDDANDGDVVIVAPGTYTGEGNRDIDFLGKAITLRSENGSDNCVIDCQGHRGFNFRNNEDVNSVLDDFTITNGYGPAEWIGGYSSPKSVGGAILCIGSNPTIARCKIEGNEASYMGGGIFCMYSSPTILECTFSENSSHFRGAGMYNESPSSPTLINCAFIENWSCWFGGGIENNGASPTLTNCTFIGNLAQRYGGGICNDHGSSPTLTNCTFSGNSAIKGGGMLNYECSPTLINCTFSGNSASTYGGGISQMFDVGGCNPTLSNCILWENTDGSGADESAQIHSGTPIINYSCIQGWTGALGGIGNIGADPGFVALGYLDANGVWIDGDYHLIENSPCIDAGDPNYVAEPNETDLDGRPRVVSGRIDMGAYEFSPPIPAEVRIVPRSINLASMGKWITCYIRLPEDYEVGDIDPNSVFLEGEIEAESLRVDEGQQVAVAKFSRSEIQEILVPGDVELTVSGELSNGTRFEGTDTIRVIDKGRKNIEY